jgi:hypothetical protein
MSFAPIYTKAHSLSFLSPHEQSSLSLSQLSLFDVAGARHRRRWGDARHRVLRSSGLRAGSFHGRGRDNAVDGGLRQVEIGLRRRACHPAMRVLLLDLRWRGSSSPTMVKRVLLAYDGVDARCL